MIDNGRDSKRKTAKNRKIEKNLEGRELRGERYSHIIKV